MIKNNSHILIVGQGIAGTILSYKLSQRNISHKVLDNNHRSAATHAAAGLINPITGRNYVKSWLIDDLLPIARQTYDQLSKTLNQSYVQEMNILRAMHTPAQENKWFSSTGRPGYQKYIVDGHSSNPYQGIVTSATYYGEITQSLQVDISKLIMDYKELLIEQAQYIDATLDYDQLLISESSVSYNNESFDLVIFCEGYKGKENSFFSDLPFQPAKGQSFTIEINNEMPDKILRDDIFLAPLNDTQLWTGGTYQNSYDDDKPSEAFRKEWTDALDNLLKVEYEITDHKAGVRPAVKGRKPLIGQSPQSHMLYMFNGMGTKATSLVPYWADHLIDHLINGTPINSEVHLDRFLFK
jgi:glycine/D-amino acid oxidase-like deaminating enzyme